MTRTQKLLSELIALPSVNPAFLPANHPRAGEHRVVDFLTATAAKAGLDVDLQQVFPQRCNLIARLSPFGEVRQRILLAPHMDTVAAGYMTILGAAVFVGFFAAFLLTTSRWAALRTQDEWGEKGD